MKFTLRKLKILEGKDSLVWDGYEQSGNHMYLINSFKDYRKQIYDIAEIELDMELMVCTIRDFLKTSPIQEIIEKHENEKIIFKTWTSIYEISQRKTLDE